MGWSPWWLGLPGGAGRAIAVELARAGFFVYATGRSSRGGAGAARVVDHEDPSQVAALVAAIFDERGRLDLLVDDIFGGDRYMEWDKPLWEHDLAGGLRMLRMGVHTHLITRQAGALRGDAGFRDLRVACLRGQGCCRAGGGGRC